MENKSITELTELILKQSDMIANKNTLLRQAFDTCSNIKKLSTMCKNVNFTNVDAANIFIHTMGTTLGREVLTRWDFLHESQVALPEAVEAEEDTVDKDGAVDDLPFVTPDEEVTTDDLPFK